MAGSGASPPHTEVTVKVVWEVPAVAVPQPDGTWRYSLLWMRLPDHTGDVLNLQLRPAAGMVLER